MSASRRVRLSASTAATSAAPSRLTAAAAGSAVAQRQPGAAHGRREEAREHRDRVELDESLLVAPRGDDHGGGDTENRDHAPVRDQEAVLPAEAAWQQPVAACVDQGQRLEDAGPREERGRRRGQEEQGAGGLKHPEHEPVARCRPRDPGKQRRVIGGKPDPEPDGERREGDRQPADDRDHQPERHAPKRRRPRSRAAGAGRSHPTAPRPRWPAPSRAACASSSGANAASAIRGDP